MNKRIFSLIIALSITTAPLCAHWVKPEPPMISKIAAITLKTLAAMHMLAGSCMMLNINMSKMSIHQFGTAATNTIVQYSALQNCLAGAITILTGIGLDAWGESKLHPKEEYCDCDEKCTAACTAQNNSSNPS